MTDKKNTYYPSDVVFTPLKHKIYLLTWQQHGGSRQKLFTKATAMRAVNDLNFPSQLKDELVEAFKRGDIA